MKHDRLDVGDFGTAFGTRKEHVSGRMAFDAVVAEDVNAPDGVRHDWPFGAYPALGTSERLRFLARTIRNGEQRGQTGLQLPHIDQWEQKDEELRKAMPKQFPVHEVEVDLTGALIPDEHRPHSEHPLRQSGKRPALKKEHKVEQASHFNRAANQS